MNTTTARRLAEAAMRQHGLIAKGWVFQWDNAKTRLGLCRYSCKTLSFSKFLTEHEEEEEFMQTVIHEIAHALVGPGHGHGVVWRRQMLAMGARPDRCGKASSAKSEARKAAANYVVTCSVSGAVIAHLDRLVKQRRLKNGGIRRYKGHTCLCHNTEVLYNGKSFDNA